MKRTFLSEQAKEFRAKYNLNSSADRQTRAVQHRIIVEEFKEFLEAEGMLFMHGRNHQEHALKELADLVYVCYQYAENMGWFLDEALNRVHETGSLDSGLSNHCWTRPVRAITLAVIRISLLDWVVCSLVLLRPCHLLDR